MDILTKDESNYNIWNEKGNILSQKQRGEKMVKDDVLHEKSHKSDIFMIVLKNQFWHFNMGSNQTL